MFQGLQVVPTPSAEPEPAEGFAGFDIAPESASARPSPITPPENPAHT